MLKQAMSLTEAYQYCMELARQHYENFPTASRLIRSDLRPAVAAIYAYARHADDIADEGDASPENRLKRLEAWELLLDRCQHKEVDHPVFMALADSVKRHHLPVNVLHDLITAFRMDVSIHSYATVDELLFYCRHSANPVGRLMLALHGIERPAALGASDAICTALQLTNFWQDLSIDLPRGRCYLPEEWLRDAGLDSQQLLDGRTDAPIDPVLEQAIAYTTGLFREGRALLPYLPMRMRLQIAATIRGGMAILKAVGRAENPLHQRPVLGRLTWFRLLTPILFDALTPPYRPRREAS